MDRPVCSRSRFHSKIPLKIPGRNWKKNPQDTFFFIRIDPCFNSDFEIRALPFIGDGLKLVR
jgi:hypothetical protein